MSSSMHGRIDAYLDGQMRPEERRIFESTLKTDATLREELDRQTAIDASLRRQFPVSSPADILKAVSAHQSTAPKAIPIRGRSPVQWLAIAAILLLCIGGGWWWWTDPIATSVVDNTSRKPRPLIEVYNAEVASGFKPSWECRGDSFRTAFNRRFGQPMLADAPAAFTTWGLSYKPAISAGSTLLLATIEGKNILVVADRADKDPGQQLPYGSTLNLFKRTYGQLVFYEVSPFTEERVISRLTLDKQTAEDREGCHPSSTQADGKP